MHWDVDPGVGFLALTHWHPAPLFDGYLSLNQQLSVSFRRYFRSSHVLRCAFLSFEPISTFTGVGLNSARSSRPEAASSNLLKDRMHSELSAAISCVTVHRQ